ncbi:MAG: glycerophosphodiester phosphodiesterase family protein [Candidatus Andersenbacteria bacterium]
MAKQRLPSLATCLLFRHPLGFWFRRRERELWATVERTRCDYIGPRASVVNRELVDRAHALGRKVYAYHANSRRRGQRLIGMGVDAIGTDHPELFAPVRGQRAHKDDSRTRPRVVREIGG